MSVPEGPRARPTQGQKPTGRAGDTLDAELCHLLAPLLREGGRFWAGPSSYSCPAPSHPRPVRTLDVCLKMKPRYASVFMMLAMFLQSSKRRERETVRWAPDPSPVSPQVLLNGCYGKQGWIQEPKALNQGVLSPGGSISSFSWAGRKLISSQGLSPIIHAGNWPACPTRPQR